jgi:hypothetical protein
MKNTITYTTSNLKRITHYFVMIILFAFIFSSIGLSQTILSPVNLGTTADFVVLAKSKISTTGTTHITGDIGISPSASTFITGFGLIMDATNTYSTSSLITGKVYSPNYTVPTPTKMTTAISDMNTAYNDGAGRLLPDYKELYTGDLSGKILTPGLYNWTNTVQVSSSGVTISGSATDIFIFQIAQNLTLTSGAIVTLSGGALASNIFWVVAGEVTIGTTVQMKGIILCKTQIAMNTGASLNGRALAQTAVTLDANAVTKPGSISSIKTDEQQMPVKFTLAQNFPNPFNPGTTIKFSLPIAAHVALNIYNAIGMEVSSLISEDMNPGVYSIQWNASGFASGVYYYKIVAGNYKETKKLLLLK